MTEENIETGPLRVAVESVLGNIFTDGNTIEILKNGDEIFPAMLEAIRSAESSIDFVTFVYWTGDIAREFAKALAERASAGVRVRVILDGFGSLPMEQDHIDDMRKAGAVVERFRPVVRWKFWESDHRTHRKVLVCDERVAFTGGVGIADEWKGDARKPEEWRDTHFRITGPAVLGLRAAFLTDWRDVGHRIDRADIAVEPPSSQGSVTVGVIDGSAQIGYNDAERVLEAMIAAAERRIIIQTPYFNPTEELTTALIEARRRRVDIDILLPGPHIDKRVSAVVAQDCYFPLVDEGIRVWIYQPTMMHVKAVLVDDELAMIGSVNINRRSVEKDEEVALVVLDRSVVAELT
ncbi:MAG: cardiolipin synthase B, partial [Acidimicrobiia bacterium]|nr:cardiolipin synthase B [Acidimicrobiia bacterium]